ncbi:MAG: hypothetical protein ACI8UO_001458 [Verrucomicrobiales bacterium]|jgi:hypothetical protein
MYSLRQFLTDAMISRITHLLSAALLPVCLVLSLSSCSLLQGPDPSDKKTVGTDLGPAGELRGLTTEEQSGDLGIKGVFPEYETGAPDAKAKIFLVAGGADIANFLQEVVDQREYFLKLGYAEEEIACYYVQPTADDYSSDQAQFATLAPKTNGFRLAAPHLLYRHLEAAAANNLDFLYLYVTGHGRQPLLPGVTLTEQPRPDEVYLIQRHPGFSGQFRLDMMGGPSGHMNLRMRVAALADGLSADQLFLTPRYLKKALSAFPPSTPKVVIIQGCYAGGFVKTDIKSLTNDALTTLPSIVTLAASSSNRQSFGCKVDSDYTYWGGLYVHTLRDEYASPIPETPWALVAASVEEKVDDLEIQLGLPEEKTSNPVYFSNVVPYISDEAPPEAPEVPEVSTDPALVSQTTPLSLMAEPNPFETEAP